MTYQPKGLLLAPVKRAGVFDWLSGVFTGTGKAPNPPQPPLESVFERASRQAREAQQKRTGAASIPQKR